MSIYKNTRGMVLNIVAILVVVTLVVVGAVVIAMQLTSDNNDDAGTTQQTTRQDTVSQTPAQCNTRSFGITAPVGWQCLEHDQTDEDVTVQTNSGTLSVSVGKNQALKSCINDNPCEADTAYTLKGYSDVVKYTELSTGKLEIIGTNEAYPSFRILVLADTALTSDQLTDIRTVANSFKVVQ